MYMSYEGERVEVIREGKKNWRIKRVSGDEELVPREDLSDWQEPDPPPELSATEISGDSIDSFLNEGGGTSPAEDAAPPSVSSQTEETKEPPSEPPPAEGPPEDPPAESHSDALTYDHSGNEQAPPPEPQAAQTIGVQGSRIKTSRSRPPRQIPEPRRKLKNIPEPPARQAPSPLAKVRGILRPLLAKAEPVKYPDTGGRQKRVVRNRRRR